MVLSAAIAKPAGANAPEVVVPCVVKHDRGVAGRCQDPTERFLGEFFLLNLVHAAQFFLDVRSMCERPSVRSVLRGHRLELAALVIRLFRGLVCVFCRRVVQAAEIDIYQIPGVDDL